MRLRAKDWLIYINRSHQLEPDFPAADSHEHEMLLGGIKRGKGEQTKASKTKE